MEPVTQGQDLKPCEREIAAVTWVPIKDYLEMEDVHDINKFFVRTFVEARERGSSIQLTEMELRLKNLRRDQNLYSVKDNSKI